MGADVEAETASMRPTSIGWRPGPVAVIVAIALTGLFVGGAIHW